MKILFRLTLLLIANTFLSTTATANRGLPKGHSSEKLKARYDELEIIYFPPSTVTGMPNTKYFNGEFINTSERYFGLRTEHAYLIDCVTTQITELANITYITEDMKKEHPQIPRHIKHVVQHDNLETKNYLRHNINKEIINVRDSAVFKLSCGYEPKAYPPND